MDKGKNYIVLQCYGNEAIFHECTYALLSLSRIYKAADLSNTEIWLYTDKPQWFSGFRDCSLPLHFRQLDTNTLQQWRGKIDFVHRVKIEALRDFVQNRSGNVIYLDTDVVCTHSLDTMWEQIANGGLYMHVMEGIVSDNGNAVMAKLNKYLQSSHENDLNGTPLNSMAMWNAGVLGFNTQYKSLIEEVLVFTDRVYPKFPKHIIEQFSFSVYFQSRGNIKAASPYIMHYWNLKEAREALAGFFGYFRNESWSRLTEYSALLQMHVLMQEKVNFLHNRSVAGKLQGKKWHPQVYDWSVLSKQI